MWGCRKAVSCALATAPTWVAAGWPFLNRMRVGMPRIENFGGVCGFSSTFSLTTLSLPLFSAATCSRIGAIIRHGPHHSAQKSTSTGSVLFRTSCSKDWSVTWVMFALMENLGRKTFGTAAKPLAGPLRVSGQQPETARQRKNVGNGCSGGSFATAVGDPTAQLGGYLSR